jgi:hypothetical protein
MDINKHPQASHSISSCLVLSCLVYLSVRTCPDTFQEFMIRGPLGQFIRQSNIWLAGRNRETRIGDAPTYKPRDSPTELDLPAIFRWEPHNRSVWPAGMMDDMNDGARRATLRRTCCCFLFWCYFLFVHAYS